MTVLVTGAAGLIGFHLCRRLLKLDEEIIGLENHFWDYYNINKYSYSIEFERNI